VSPRDADAAQERAADTARSATWGRRRGLIALALASFAGTLAAVEISLRLAGGALLGAPDPTRGVRMIGGGYPGVHDPRLGFVPEPGRSDDNVWGVRVTITADGVRGNGADPPPGAPILAVGDSFTFGDEVGDHETWPARLEALLGRPVVNGGVFGYGLDQIALRAEQLLDRTGAKTLVVSFTADDVRRCEYAYRYAWKPWFAVEGGALALRGVPVPAPGTPPAGEAAWRSALRASFLADLVMRRLDPDGWLLPDSVRAHRQGVVVGRLLIDRLADAAAERGHRLLLVVQWHPLSDVAESVPLVQHARARGLALLDLEPLLRREIAAHPQGAERLFRVEHAGGVVAVGHLTPAGNELVAGAIAEVVRSTALSRAPERVKVPGLAPR
jgi:hypothetical protein